MEACSEIAEVHVSEIYTLSDSIELIETYGSFFSCRTEAKNIIQKLNFKLADFAEFMKDIQPKKVAYFIWRNPWMVAREQYFYKSHS